MRVGTFTVLSSRDLVALRTMRPIPKIVLAVSTLDSRRRSVMEAKLNRYRDACGCSASAAFLIVALLASLVAGAAWWQAGGLGLVAAVIGKLVGIASGRYLFRQWLDIASREMSVPMVRHTDH